MVSKEITFLEEQIRRKLVAEFTPEILEIKNESLQHTGHNPDAKRGNTHFKIRIISRRFSGLSHVQKHKLVFASLEQWIDNPIHALSIQAYALEPGVDKIQHG